MRKFLRNTYYHTLFFLTKTYLKYKKVSYGTEPLFMHGLPLIRSQGKTQIGDNFRISSYQFKPELFCSKGANLKIGNNVFINRGTSISASKNISIGDHCLIGDMVTISDSNWHEVAPDRSIKMMDIVIGKNVWIGKNAIILPGVQIGDHAVISAGCIITKDVPAKSVIYQEKINKIIPFDCDDNYIRK